MKMTMIAAGTSNTVLAVEAKEGVIWTQPLDLKVPGDKSALPVGGHFKEGFHVVMCDGSVRTMPANTEPAQLRSMIIQKQEK
jgi:hypothetical protein